LLSDGNGVGDGQFQQSQHLNALLECGSDVLFMGESAWYYVKYLVYAYSGGSRQRQMCDCGWVESASQYSESSRSSTRAMIELHLPTV
jgi:hypothetical protein